MFKDEEREQFVSLMRRYESFCQVKVWNYCVMSNHFHLLLEIPAGPECGGASWSDERLLDHLSGHYGERKMAELRWELELYREQDNEVAAEAFRQRIFDRMWDTEGQASRESSASVSPPSSENAARKST